MVHSYCNLHGLLVAGFGGIGGIPPARLMQACERYVSRRLQSLMEDGLLNDKEFCSEYVEVCSAVFRSKVRHQPRVALAYLLIGREVGALHGIRLQVLPSLPDIEQ